MSSPRSPGLYFISFAERTWGAEASLLTIGEGLARLGHVGGLLSASADLRSAWRARVGGPTARLVRLRIRAIRQLPLALRLAQMRRGSTVVLFDHKSLRAAMRLRWLLRLKGIRAFHDVHNFATAKDDVGTLARGVAGAICVSRAVAAAYTGICPASVVWRPVPSDQQLKIQPGDPPGRVVVGIVGRLDREKRIDWGIKVMAASGDTSARLVVRGAPFKDQGEYLAEIERLGARFLGDRFAYEGLFPQSTALSGIDILLHCNPAEPSGRTVAEVQAQGKLVVAPAQGGVAEFVESGVTGFVYDFGNTESAVEALRAAIQEQRSSVRVRRAALAHAGARYAPEQQCRAYAAALGLPDPDTPAR